MSIFGSFFKFYNFSLDLLMCALCICAVLHFCYSRSFSLFYFSPPKFLVLPHYLCSRPACLSLSVLFIFSFNLPWSSLVSLSEVSCILSTLLLVVCCCLWISSHCSVFGTFKTIYSHQFLIFSSLCSIVMVRNVKWTCLTRSNSFSFSFPSVSFFSLKPSLSLYPLYIALYVSLPSNIA